MPSGSTQLKSASSIFSAAARLPDASAAVTASSAFTTSLCAAGVCARNAVAWMPPNTSAIANSLFMEPPVDTSAYATRMSAVLDRFLRYVQYDTQADETSASYPSTPKQLTLLRDLAAELKALGVADAAMDAHGYVTATVPATSRKKVPAI